MNFNISKNVLSAIFVQSAPARARNSVIAAVILLLLVFAGFVYAGSWDEEMGKNYNNLLDNRSKNTGSQTPIRQTQGTKDWNAGALQVNNALSQMRQQAQGVPGAMQYVIQAEKLWKQAQAQWAMQQRNLQQSGLNQMQMHLLAQQQDFMNQLNKQQQFLQQQLAYLNTPLKKRMDEDNLQHFGRLLQPDMNAKGGPGWKSWEEAMRQLDSIGISSTSSSSSTSPAASSKATNKGGAYDKPLADDAIEPREPLEPKKLSEDISNLSDEQLESRRQALITQLKGLKKSSENVTAQHDENGRMRQDNMNQTKSDFKDAIQAIYDDKKADWMPDKNLFPEDTSSKPKPSAVEKGVDKVIEVLENIPDSIEPFNEVRDGAKNTLKTGKFAGHVASSLETDYYVNSNQGNLQSQLDQIEQARQSVFDKLKATIEEQNRRKSAFPSNKPEPKADPAPTQPRILSHDELELGIKELPNPRPLVGPDR